MKPVNGINKDVCDAKLLPTTVLACSVDCVCFCHLLKTQHSRNSYKTLAKDYSSYSVILAWLQPSTTEPQ